MNFYKFNLLLCSILLIVGYFAIPFYNDWLVNKAASPNNSIFDQMQNLDVNHRKEYRFGAPYMVYMDIARMLSKQNNPTVLLPTTDYMRSVSISVDMPEPAVFYYFTGIKSVWANSPGVEKANWALIASKKKGMRIMDITSNTQLDSLISMYKQYTK